MTSGSRALFADCEGRITRLAVQIQAYLFTEGYAAEKAAYEALLQTFPHDVTISVLFDAAMAADVAAWLSGLRLACVYNPVGVPGGKVSLGRTWMRDAFLCVTDNTTIQYLKPYISKQGGDQANWLAAVDGRTVTELDDIFLDGGDSLVGNNFRLVGNRAVTTTCEVMDHQCDYPTALGRFARLDHRRVYPVGYRPSRVEHKLLWFKDQVRRRLEAARQQKTAALAPPGGLPTVTLTLLRAMLEVLRLFFADGLVQDWAHIDLVVSVTGREPNGKQVLLVAKTELSPNPGEDEILESDRLEALAAYLSDCGFEVRRNPAPYLADPGISLCYNNTIVQTGPDKVWLPQFSDANPDYQAADDANARIWHEDLGFDVVRVPGWMIYVDSSASIRCATNVLERQ
ncbi:hypothetical protein [Mesorhizobium sp. M0019]|uniref:hypothetical protein n=1 Tax=Mesorhizobium sp. M0019 TaxID=2956845 RepID=UPI003338F3D7